MNKKLLFLLFFAFINQSIFSQGPWTFSNSNDVWESTSTSADLTTSATYSILDVNGAANPQLRSYQASIVADSLNTAIIKIKNNTSNPYMRVFYNNGASLSDFSDTGSGWKYTSVTISTNDTEVKTYYVKLDSDAAWTGTINNIVIQFREDTNYNSALDDGLGNIYIYDVTFTKYKWTFDAASSDWTKDNATSLVYNGTDATLTLKTNNTGYNGIKTTVGIVGEDYNYLVVRIQNSSDRSKLRVRFDKDDSGYGYKTIDISTNDTGFKTYYVNMGSLTTWDTSGIKDDVTIQIGTNTTNPGTTIFDDVRFLSSSKDINQLTFDGDADYQTLSAANGSSIANNDGYATWTLDGNNNNAKLEMKTSGFYYTTDADMNKLVTVELVNVSANDELAFVSTASGQEFTPISMNPNDTDDPNGTAQSIIFNITKDGWSGATNNSWFLRARNSSNDNAVESGKIYIKSITFSDNTTPIETIADGDWANNGTWYGGVAPSFKQTVNIKHNVTASSFFNMRLMTIDSGKSFITTSTFSGDVTYNRNLGTNNWYLISSPVVGQDIDAFVASEGLASGTTGNNLGLSDYNNTTPGWEYYQNGASGTGSFTSGDGRAIKLASTGDIAFTGTINTSDVNISITDATGSGGNAFNLVGNPYPSFIAANNSADATNNILKVNDTDNDYLSESTLWFWNQGTNSYDQINHASSAKYIAPGQGFFVSATGSVNLSITEAMQSHQGTDSFQRLTTRPEIALSLSNGTAIRNADIYYIEGTTTGWDNGYDSSIFGGVSNEFAIYTHAVANGNGRDLGIQSLPPNNYENMVVPVGINAEAGTSISIDAATNNFPEGINIYLEDKQDNSFTLLEADSNFSFTPENNLSGIGRFYLHTTSGVLSADDFDINKNISIYTSSNDNLRIVGVQNGTATVRLYNILGKEMLKTSFEGNGVNDIKVNDIPIGIYIVKLTTENGTLNRKIIIQY